MFFIDATVMILLSWTLLGLLLPAPLNPLWHLTSGIYEYDPRVTHPPAGLVVDRPEDLLHYYLDATLEACDRHYPPVSLQPVQRYEVETVVYDGHSNYHALSFVQTRLFYADAPSVLVTFRFEAGHNEADVWYLEHGSIIRAGAWFAVGGLVESARTSPPGWVNTPGTPSTTCADVSVPDKISR
jgi:hypothetical protein